MKSILQLIGTRLVPAFLTAAGVVLVTAGLLSYADPGTVGVTPNPSEEAVVEGTLDPSDEPSFEITSPSPDPSGSTEPGPSGSTAPSATPVGTAPSSIKPDPTRKPGRAVATRVVVPALNIDMPVVKGNDGYPYCDVAMYLHTNSSASTDAFGQPGEGRGTYLYAHARDGMFGPIYHLAIERKTPKKMLGMVVKVYASDFKLYLYEIDYYRLHATGPAALDGVISATKEQVWLQTSEGPKGTPGKTQLRAHLISVSDADARESVPKAKPVKCG
jgi:hypothetical protein